MAGKYKPVSTAEKRAQIEAAGEEWPIGSDGLAKVWSPSSSRVNGGKWLTRSAHRANSRKKAKTYRERHRQRLVEQRRKYERDKYWSDPESARKKQRDLYRSHPHIRLMSQLREMTRIRIDY